MTSGAASGGILIRCDGSPAIGLGHVMRCLGLAGVLRDRHHREVTFAMRTGPLAIQIARKAGFDVVEAPERPGVDDVSWLIAAAAAVHAETLVVDVRDGLGASDLRTIRDRADVRIAVIDDTSERRLAADEIFLPPVPQAMALAWPDFQGRAYIGWDWVLLRPEFAGEPVRVHHDPPLVLVTMGGSDPAGLTLQAARALARVTRPIRCIVLLGPGFGHDAALAPLLEASPHECQVVRDGDVHANMLAADLALLSFGVTAYEAAASGLAAVHLCLTDDHALSSSAFAEAGLAMSLGRSDEVEDARLAEVFDALLADDVGRDAMGSRARRLIDGKGTARIAEVIAAGGS